MMERELPLRDFDIIKSNTDLIFDRNNLDILSETIWRTHRNELIVFLPSILIIVKIILEYL